MPIKPFIFSVAGSCLLLCGCPRQQVAGLPRDCFRLTVQEVISDSDIQVVVLSVQARRPASLSVDTASSHSHVALPQGPDNALREGRVMLSAARVVPAGDPNAYIQVLTRPEVAGGFAGGPAVYTVTADTPLESFWSVSATDGVFRLDTPVTIAQLQGQSVTLAVGRPTK